MADKTNTPTSVAALLALSRTSGPAVVYNMAEDGTIATISQRPARPPWRAGRLNVEQMLALLKQTGRIPETLAPEARCGMQPGDMENITSGRRMGLIRAHLSAHDIMDGFTDDGYSDRTYNRFRTS